ncbi:hypothetical protein NEOKW01_0952 [Nematocida sp. AWRm80]|nr:hypothetical protein NEOKW01_0952 [Nematocida sp. AWRm80]
MFSGLVNTISNFRISNLYNPDTSQESIELEEIKPSVPVEYNVVPVEQSVLYPNIASEASQTNSLPKTISNTTVVTNPPVPAKSNMLSAVGRLMKIPKDTLIGKTMNGELTLLEAGFEAAMLPFRNVLVHMNDMIDAVDKFSNQEMSWDRFFNMLSVMFFFCLMCIFNIKLVLIIFAVVLTHFFYIKDDPSSIFASSLEKYKEIIFFLGFVLLIFLLVALICYGLSYAMILIAGLSGILAINQYASVKFRGILSSIFVGLTITCWFVVPMLSSAALAVLTTTWFGVLVILAGYLSIAYAFAIMARYLLFRIRTETRLREVTKSFEPKERPSPTEPVTWKFFIFSWFWVVVFALAAVLLTILSFNLGGIIATCLLKGAMTTMLLPVQHFYLTLGAVIFTAAGLAISTLKNIPIVNTVTTVVSNYFKSAAETLNKHAHDLYTAIDPIINPIPNSSSNPNINPVLIPQAPIQI